jgi:hypothetical protein
MSPEVSTYEDRQLYSTWQLSLDHIKQQSELSAKLLKLWAYFDNQDLWFELLREERTGGPDWWAGLALSTNGGQGGLQPSSEGAMRPRANRGEEVL